MRNSKVPESLKNAIIESGAADKYAGLLENIARESVDRKTHTLEILSAWASVYSHIWLVDEINKFKNVLKL